jgi:hypothetical protein
MFIARPAAEIEPQERIFLKELDFTRPDPPLRV